MSTVSTEQIHIGKYTEARDWNTINPELVLIKDLESKAKKIITCVNAALSQTKPFDLTTEQISTIFHKLAREGTLGSKRIINDISNCIDTKNPIELIFHPEDSFLPQTIKLSFLKKI